MSLYVANLVVVAVLLAMAAYWQQQRNTKTSLLPPQLQEVDRHETIDDELHDLDRCETTADKFFSFRNRFLRVYGLATAADWLQVRSAKNTPRLDSL